MGWKEKISGIGGKNASKFSIYSSLMHS